MTITTDTTGRASDDATAEATNPRAKERFAAIVRASNLWQREAPYCDEHGALNDQELMARLQAAHQRIAAGQAEVTLLATELYRRRRNQDLQWDRNAACAGEYAAPEAAAALHVNRGQAYATIDTGLELVHRLPSTLTAFAAAKLDAAQVRAIVEEFSCAGDDVADLLEERVVEFAIDHDPSCIHRTVKRWVTKADPESARRRRQIGEDERHVDISPGGDGIAHLHARLPVLGGYTVWERLREMAYTQVCKHDGRTVPQRRADALIALADGTGRLVCRCAREDCSAPGADEPAPEPRRPLVQVGVSDRTLFNVANDPGFLAGYGCIDPHLARLIAQHATFVVVPETEPDRRGDNDNDGNNNGCGTRPDEETPPSPVTPMASAGDTPAEDTPVAHSGDTTAASTDAGSDTPGQDTPIASGNDNNPGRDPELVYRPGAALARRVRALDGECRGPGCHIPAHRCDIDHERPFDHDNPDRGGTTCEENTNAKCRRDHRLKTLSDNGKSDWTTRTVDHKKRLVEWITPTGVRITTAPEGMPYLFPRTEPPIAPVPDKPIPEPEPSPPDQDWEFLKQFATPPEDWPTPPDPADIDREDRQRWEEAVRAKREADYKAAHPPSEYDPNTPPPF